MTVRVKRPNERRWQGKRMPSIDLVPVTTGKAVYGADVILPGPSPLEDFHYDVAFPQLSWRNHARYSAPVLPRPDGQPEEWQTLLKLAAIVQGKGVNLDADTLDDAQFADDAQRLFGAHQLCLWMAFHELP